MVITVLARVAALPARAPSSTNAKTGSSDLGIRPLGISDIDKR
jgi:hypothetical protein